MVLSVSATFAVSDDNADTIALDDEMDDGVVATDVVSDSEIGNANDESALKEAPVVTKDNFHDYFDSSGTLTSNVDELVFEGNFTGLDVSQIMISGTTPVKFTGKNATFTNVQFMIMQNDVSIDGFNLITDDSNLHTRLIWIGNDDYLSNIVLSNNNITFIGPKNDEAFAIYAGADENMGFYSISGLKIINNNITYVGNTDGTKTNINNVIRVSGDDFDVASDNITVSGNIFDIKIPSVKIPRGYFDEPNPVSEGIVFYYCEDVKFIDNRINLSYNNVSGASDTINIVSAYANSIYMTEDSNILIKGNEINALGHYYTYGIFISADGFEISDNNINITSDIYYACGIDIEGPSSAGKIVNNNISINVPTSSENKYSVGAAYGIYSAQVFGAIRDVTYEKNTIDANGYFACGMELMHPDPITKENVITCDGNYTCGIVGSLKPTGYTANIENNTIYCTGSNVGTAYTGDTIVFTNSIGIDVLGDAVVKNNKIASTEIGISVVKDKHIPANAVIDGNTIGVYANNGKVDNFAIVVSGTEGVANVTITNNNVSYVGMVDNQFVIVDYTDWGPVYDSSNNTRAYAVYIEDSDAVIKGNTFNISIPTFAVNWGVSREAFSEGIVLVGCDDLVFEDNDVLLIANGGSSWDTIYGIDVFNCAHPVIINNNLTVDGMGYAYAIIINDNGFDIANNTIVVGSDNYACGIDVEGPASGSITGNKIGAIAAESAYPVYSGMSGYPVDVNIADNNVFGEAYYVVGMEIAGNYVLVENNNVLVKGNHTIGIGSDVAYLKVDNNNISALASNEGNVSVWDNMGTDNVGILIHKGNASISNSTIYSNAMGVKIVAAGGYDYIGNNTIETIANSGKVNNHAIFAEDIEALGIQNNNITFYGLVDNQFVIIGYDDWGYPIYNTTNNTKAYGLYIKNSNVGIKNNTFDIAIPAFTVNWAGGYIREAFSEGIVLEGCDGLGFVGNDVIITANGGSSWDTIYGIDVLNSANATVEDNEIGIEGMGYTYGIIINDAFNIDNNTILVTSDNYACGIDVEGPASGVISDNRIGTVASDSAYPVYSGMNYMPVSVNITGNEISGLAYYVVGVEVGGDKVLIEGNNISVSGNHTIGVGSAVDDLVVNNNSIISTASNEGDVPVWDSMGTDTTGVKVADGDFTISNNEIETNGDYAAVLGDNNGTVTNNDLISNNGAGNDAIIGLGNVNATGNPATKNKFLKTILFANDFTKVYGSADQFTVKLVDENGKGVGNKTIILAIDGVDYTNKTDADGYAAFDINFVKGEYYATAKFAGDDEYGSKSTKSTITVTPKPTEITAPNLSVLLTAIKKGYAYKIALKDDSGNVLANKTVNITFNGVTKEYTTDSNGLVSYKLSASKAGTQKLTVKFAGDDKYNATSKVATIKITKEKTKLVAKNAVLKNKKYTVTLKDSKGKAIKKVRVTIKVKGKTYKATTNSKGKATFKITKLTKKGKYSAKVKFAGNNYYLSSTKSVKITVKK